MIGAFFTLLFSRINLLARKLNIPHATGREARHRTKDRCMGYISKERSKVNLLDWSEDLLQEAMHWQC